MPMPRASAIFFIFTKVGLIFWLFMFDMWLDDLPNLRDNFVIVVPLRLHISTTFSQNFFTDSSSPKYSLLNQIPPKI